MLKTGLDGDGAYWKVGLAEQFLRLAQLHAHDLRPVIARKRRCNMAREAGTYFVNSRTCRPLQACSRIILSAMLTAESEIADTSDDCRTTTARGGISSGSLGAGFPAIRRSRHAAAWYPTSS